MYPNQVPVFSKDDILISENEYESDDGRKTTVGWLKELFLFDKLDAEHLWISADSRKIFTQVLDKFCRYNIIRKDGIHDWEDKTPAKKQAACLNKFMRKLGYTQVEEIDNG